MSWDNDAMSVLPQDWQDDIADNFSPEYLAEKLSDYIAKIQADQVGKQLVSDKAISYLYNEWPSVYREFYLLV